MEWKCIHKRSETTERQDLESGFREIRRNVLLAYSDTGAHVSLSDTQKAIEHMALLGWTAIGITSTDSSFYTSEVSEPVRYSGTIDSDGHVELERSGGNSWTFNRGEEATYSDFYRDYKDDTHYRMYHRLDKADGYLEFLIGAPLFVIGFGGIGWWLFTLLWAESGLPIFESLKALSQTLRILLMFGPPIVGGVSLLVLFLGLGPIKCAILKSMKKKITAYEQSH